MTDEEMAEEWIKDHSGLIGSYKFVKYDYDSLKQAYLAGLKAGRPKWHNLKSDPCDLPSDRHGHVVINQDCDKVVIRNGRFEYLDGVKADVIAWCEKPKYEKE